MEETSSPSNPTAHGRLITALHTSASATLRELAIGAQRRSQDLRVDLLQLHLMLHVVPDALYEIVDAAALVKDLRELVTIAEALGDPLLERNPGMTVALFPRGSKLDEPTGIFPSKSIAERVGRALFDDFVIGPWMTDSDRRRTLAEVRGLTPED